MGGGWRGKNPLWYFSVAAAAAEAGVRCARRRRRRFCIGGGSGGGRACERRRASLFEIHSISSTAAATGVASTGVPPPTAELYKYHPTGTGRPQSQYTVLRSQTSSVNYNRIIVILLLLLSSSSIKAKDRSTVFK